MLVLWSLLSCDQLWNSRLESKFPKLGSFPLLVRRLQSLIIFTEDQSLPFLPSTQRDRSLTSKNSHQAMQGGPSKIQTKGQDSLLSLVDPRISIPLEPQDQIYPHLKWDSSSIVQSIFIHPRVSMTSWTSKALLCCRDACIMDPYSSTLPL